MGALMSRVMQTGSSSVLGADRRQQQTVSVARRIAGALGLWTMRRRTRKQLSELSHHMLEDIGVTHAQARREAERPFWQG